MARIVAVPEKVPATVAQQVFTIGSGVAGGLAGFLLAKELAGTKEVPASALAGATLISAVFTFGAAIMLARTVKGAASD